MDLKLFFEPIMIDFPNQAQAFQVYIYSNTDQMPDHEGMDCALIGLEEYRGENGSTDNFESVNAIRKELYSLAKGSGTYQIIDLGNLRSGPSLKDTYLRLKEVCFYLIRKGIVPILFGGSHDLDIGQYMGYENLDKLVSLLNIDNRIDLDGDSAATTHCEKIIAYTPNYLFHLNQIGFQTYLTSPSSIELLENLSFESIRLGEIREDIKRAEPLIRDADMISFDLSALNARSIAGVTSSKPFGFLPEEACQLCWYAGLNEKLSSFGIFGYRKSQDEKSSGAFIIATMVWYFIEGFYNRKGDKNFFSNDYLSFETHLGGSVESITFYKSKLSDRWWMEVPQDSKTLGRSKMIPCNYEDYEKASQGEIPDRWFKHIN